MGKMAYISYLCETENTKKLIEELNIPQLISLTGKTPEEIAKGFIDAHRKIRKNKNNHAYDKLNEIHDKMQKDI